MTLISAVLDVIDAHPSLAAHDPGGVYAEAAQFTYHGIGHRVFLRQNGYESCGQAQLRECDRHVGLAASKSRHELPGLKNSFEARRCEPQHDFAKSYDRLCHVPVFGPLYFVINDASFPCLRPVRHPAWPERRPHSTKGR